MNDKDNRSLKVFLCHAHADHGAVRVLYSRLKREGVDAWLDKEKLLPGSDWELEIRKAVRESDVVVVCLSKQFNQAGFRQKEVRLALDTAMEQPEGEIFIIPARLEECDVLESLRKWRWVDLFEADGNEKLKDALHIRAKNIGAVLQVQTPRKMKPKYIITTIIIAVLIGLLSQFLPIYLPPNKMPTTSLTSTKSFPFTHTPLPIEITDAEGVTMRLVDAGKFMMGSDSGDSDERPAHMVYLNVFYIDKYEVTNSIYKACVEADVCKPPANTHSRTRSSYFDNIQYDNYPVIYVDWNMAKTFCKWRNARLPTEAEWEKAAHGIDGRTYPWGNEIDKTLANYSSNMGDTTSVGSHEGKSPFDVYDMVGNVWEWVADWYDAGYYSTLEENISNPYGPASGQYRILRGGSWSDDEDILRASNRLKSQSDVINFNIGFRCARDMNP